MIDHDMNAVDEIIHKHAIETNWEPFKQSVVMLEYANQVAEPLESRIAILESALAESNVALHNMTTFPETYTDDMYNDWIFSNVSPLAKALAELNCTHPVVSHPLLTKETS